MSKRNLPFKAPLEKASLNSAIVRSECPLDSSDLNSSHLERSWHNTSVAACFKAKQLLASEVIRRASWLPYVNA